MVLLNKKARVGIVEKDNLTLLIETLLKTIEEYALIETSDGKYSIHLKKTNYSTMNGKSYEVIITNKKWTAYDEVN